MTIIIANLKEMSTYTKIGACYTYPAYSKYLPLRPLTASAAWIFAAPVPSGTAVLDS